mmetsp:Transcript_26408/g.56163  ORF Transcript_26408/g.56163 Transcript_26408/m.56163 type:complete len:232 (-) Transcript_26408:448-1143(-)
MSFVADPTLVRRLPQELTSILQPVHGCAKHSPVHDDVQFLLLIIIFASSIFLLFLMPHLLLLLFALPLMLLLLHSQLGLPAQEIRPRQRPIVRPLLDVAFILFRIFCFSSVLFLRHVQRPQHHAPHPIQAPLCPQPHAYAPLLVLFFSLRRVTAAPILDRLQQRSAFSIHHAPLHNLVGVLHRPFERGGPPQEVCDVDIGPNCAHQRPFCATSRAPLLTQQAPRNVLDQRR